MARVLLTAVDVADDRLSWRWRLTDEAGVTLAEHKVVIDPVSPEAKAFADLSHHLRWNADPDHGRRRASEVSIVERVGRWAGAQVLGPSVCSAIAAAAPVSVCVRAPDFLLSTPLEIAHIDGVPLARRGDISFVYDVGGVGLSAVPPRDRLRMVAVFSLPTETTALGLRRERYELTRMVRTLAARAQRMVELEVLQYGVTRAELAERMAFDGGPDILHLSGHGGAGLLYLEGLDGRPDPVSTDEFLALLRPARNRLRLTVLSACESTAAVTAETLRRLKLDAAAEQAQSIADAEDNPIEVGIAGQVARQLGCAVLAMRYRVADDFAIALAGSLYEGLFSLCLPIDAALRRAITVSASEAGTALSVATPALIGASAIGSRLTPPSGPPPPAESPMPAFPGEPVRFVGRAGVMARASRALAPGSGLSGVLFQGMAGAGKTACALELAYRRRFTYPVWWQAPVREDEWPQALTGFALACEGQVPGLMMVDKISTAETLEQFLPRLRGLLRDNGLLLVLDNLETLLTPAGEWRDPRWAQLMDALTSHGGQSRVILTSRVKPAGLPPAIQVEPVHALSRDESVLLARELPHLRRLLDTDPSRGTVRRILRAVQGHPKLLELADAAAADLDTLAGHLADGDDHGLNAFFTHGESTLDETGFLNTLAAWTRSATTTLPAASQLLLQLLAGLENGDRWSFVLEGNWADLCRRLKRETPDLAATVSPLTTAALVETYAVKGAMRYVIHPGIAEAIRAGTPPDVRTAIDTELGAYWAGISARARQLETGEHTGAVVRAGLAAAPYLLRLHQWDAAAALIDHALLRDRTVAVAQIAITYLQRITEATKAPIDAAKLGRATRRVNPAEGERILRAALSAATDNNDMRLASNIVGELINLLRASGRLHEALDLAQRKAELSRQAGFGPWTRLSDEYQRLQMLHLVGQTEHLHAEVRRLIEFMKQLPDRPADNESVEIWNVREPILNLGVQVAVAMQRWEEALELADLITASKQERGAGEHAVAQAKFNGYAPLLRLGRLDEAEQLLLACQQIFADHQDIPLLAATLNARADLALRRGHHLDAISLQQTALRLSYSHAEPATVSACHYGLAILLGRAHLEPAERLAHLLAAAIIAYLTGQAAEFEDTSDALSRAARQLTNVSLPATLEGLAALVERVDGIRFLQLVGSLSKGDQRPAEETLRALLGVVRQAQAERSAQVQSQLDKWEPILHALFLAAHGDQEAARSLNAFLVPLSARQEWSALVTVLQRILAGERDSAELIADLDPIDTAIATRALDALAGRITLAPPG